jgi:hypothetical protein
MNRRKFLVESGFVGAGLLGAGKDRAKSASCWTQVGF